MGDYHLLMQFDIEAEPESVRRALVSREGLTSWWSSHVDAAGADQWHVSFPDVPAPFQLIVDRDEPEVVQWRVGEFPPHWQGTSIRWEVGPNPDGAGTRLLFSHRDFDPDNPSIPVVTPAWARIIDRLKAYAETGTAGPYFDW